MLNGTLIVLESFDFGFTRLLAQIPVTYPTTSPEIAIPELDGKTAKMYRYVLCLISV